MFKVLFLLSVFLGLDARDSRWPALRSAYLRAHPRCEACGTWQALQVHHIIPVSVDPSKELDCNNLMTLCKKNCHLKIGHSGNCKKFNPSVRIDVQFGLESATQLAKQHGITGQKELTCLD